MSFIRSTSSVANQHAEYDNMSPCPNITPKASGPVKKRVRPVSARVSGNSRLAKIPVSRRSRSFGTKSPLSPLSPRFSNKSPGSPSHPEIPSSTHKPAIRRPSVGESKSKTGKPRRRPSSANTTGHTARLGISLTTSTKKETADDTVDKNDSEFSKFKMTNKGTRNNAMSRERKRRLVDAKFRETRNNFMSKMLEIRDCCFDKKVWEAIQQAFESHIRTKKEIVSLQAFMRALESIPFFQSQKLMDVILKLVTPSSPQNKQGLDYRGFLSVMSAVYSMAHPTLQPGDNSVTVVLLQDAASAATDISDKLSKAVKDLGDQNLEVKIRFIPLPRVEKMDIREQLWHLDIPVDMTLMFYDRNLPQQPNARKLRIAFPKMKICLCGDNSHLQDALGIHGQLQPSQWKLRHAIADDFIVNPFLDIQIPLATALKLKCKKLPTTGHSHLQWAKQHLNGIPEEMNTVRVSTSSIDDIQRDFFARRLDGNVVTGQPSDDIPYVYQGDAQMYTRENLEKRKELCSNSEIGEAIRAFWHVLDLTKDSFGAICMDDFLIMNIKIQKTLIPGLRINDAIPTALKDWRNDCAQGRFMTEKEFFECFFEMADIWCSTVDPSEYVIFLMSLLLSTTMVHAAPEGCLRWRNDKDITNDNFKREVKKLRVDVASEPAIAMPASNTREKWEEGAEVETEGASGKWWWGTVTACHDDGTYDIAVDDDTEGGGQEWKHVRPVHLRSRVQLERPQGIAIRPGADIPQWDGDDGAAFKKVVGRWEYADPDDSTDTSEASDSEYEYSSGDEAGAAGTAHKYSKDSNHYQSKYGGSFVSGDKSSPLSGGKGSRLSGVKDSRLSGDKSSRLSGGKARDNSSADKAGTPRRRRRRRRTKKFGRLNKMARRETARSDQIFGFGEQFAGKSERGAESKHKQNSSEQRQADYDAKMSNESKSNRTGRQNNGHPQSEATTTPGGRLPQHHSLDKIKKIPGPHLSESGGSLLEQKSKHPVGATHRFVENLERKASSGQDSSHGHRKDNGYTVVGTSKSERRLMRTHHRKDKDNGYTVVGTSKSKRRLMRTHSRQRAKSRRDRKRALERQRMKIHANKMKKKYIKSKMKNLNHVLSNPVMNKDLTEFDLFRPEIAPRRYTSDKNQTWKDKLRSKLRLDRLSSSNVSRPDDITLAPARAALQSSDDESIVLSLSSFA